MQSISYNSLHYCNLCIQHFSINADQLIPFVSWSYHNLLCGIFLTLRCQLMYLITIYKTSFVLTISYSQKHIQMTRCCNFRHLQFFRSVTNSSQRLSLSWNRTGNSQLSRSTADCGKHSNFSCRLRAVPQSFLPISALSRFALAIGKKEGLLAVYFSCHDDDNIICTL